MNISDPTLVVMSDGARPPLSRMNVVFLLVVHLLALGGLPLYAALVGVSGGAVIIGVAWTVFTVFSLSAGYHRLFSHRTYAAHPILRLFLLCFGAAAFQNSAISWAADHRRHHKRVDSDDDPYSIRRGFWYAHVGWVLRQAPIATHLQPVPDLERDPLLRWQHRHYPLIGAATGFVLPLLCGLALGDPWGGLVLGGLVRLVLVYHVTFAVNSFAHTFGSQPYSDRDSSRDSHLVALLTMGEGYHNFHHTFPSDYRNGCRAFHLDPSKWLLRVLATVRLARDLKITPAPVILRARFKMEQARVSESRLPAPVAALAQQWRERALEILTGWQGLVVRYEAIRSQRGAQARQMVRRCAAEMRQRRADFLAVYSQWRRLIDSQQEHA